MVRAQGRFLCYMRWSRGRTWWNQRPKILHQQQIAGVVIHGVPGLRGGHRLLEPARGALLVLPYVVHTEKVGFLCEFTRRVHLGPLSLTGLRRGCWSPEVRGKSFPDRSLFVWLPSFIFLIVYFRIPPNTVSDVRGGSGECSGDADEVQSLHGERFRLLNHRLIATHGQRNCGGPGVQK